MDENTKPHRHDWNVTGRRYEGDFRTCRICGTQQTKNKGRWLYHGKIVVRQP